MEKYLRRCRQLASGLPYTEADRSATTVHPAHPARQHWVETTHAHPLRHVWPCWVARSLLRVESEQIFFNILATCVGKASIRAPNREPTFLQDAE